MKQDGPLTFAVDVGGTGLKATILDARGRMAVGRQRVATPYPCHPNILLDAIAGLAKAMPDFDRISLGFPGVVRDGRIVTAPHFGTGEWRGTDLASALERRFKKPARILNDAEIQGLGIVAGRGLEVVLTFGTGLGSAVFSNGHLAPHLELAHHPVTRHKTYDDYIGDAARKAAGRKRWNRRVLKVIAHVDTLLNYDRLYLGGGNATRIDVEIPANVRLADNNAGLTGGIRLWDDAVWNAVPAGAARQPMRSRAPA